MQVILKVIQRTYFGKHSFGNLFVCTENLFETVRPEFHTCLQVQKFAERESAKIIAFRNITQFEVFFFQPHHGRTGEYDFQVRITVVAHTEFFAPFGMLKHLVDQQNFSATFLKLVGKVYDAMPREIEIVHVDEQTGTVGAEFLFGVLQEESGFSYATCPFDTNQAVTPVNLVHKIAANGGIGVLNKVSVCAIE